MAAFEMIGVMCMLAYTISQLNRILARPEDYNNIQSYEDFGEHPGPYGIVALVCFLWTLSTLLFLFGVRRFHARLVEMHLVWQVVASVICVVIVIAVSAQVAGHGHSSNDPEWDPASVSSTTISTTQALSTAEATLKRRLTEQVGLLTCSLYLLAVEAWGMSVVYDCYKYFKLCQVLVNLATSKGRGPGPTSLSSSSHSGVTTSSRDKSGSVSTISVNKV